MFAEAMARSALSSTSWPRGGRDMNYLLGLFDEVIITLLMYKWNKWVFVARLFDRPIYRRTDCRAGTLT